MQPALNPDTEASSDYVFLSRWAVKNFTVERGDIVSLISPKDPDQKIIKRVVALQGDVVSTLGYKKPFVRIPEGHCWVEGDHTGLKTVLFLIVCSLINRVFCREFVRQQLLWTYIGWPDDSSSDVHSVATSEVAATSNRFTKAEKTNIDGKINKHKQHTKSKNSVNIFVPTK